MGCPWWLVPAGLGHCEPQKEIRGRGRTRGACCLNPPGFGAPPTSALVRGPSSAVLVHTGLWEHCFLPGPSGGPAVSRFLP